ncbi:uncharacterized protein AruCF_2216 [Achromobacter ruhlandii]|nr:uncharacterized protein AruCF_2216 [Achromobacter ruhlandii]
MHLGRKEVARQEEIAAAFAILGGNPPRIGDGKAVAPGS